MVQIVKRSRKQRTEAAIGYALERRWDLAAAENRSLITEFPDDIEAANRLGKALTELGELEEAAQAYRRSLAIDASNVIARRNLTRIEEMQAEAGKTKRPAAAGKRARATAAPKAPAAPPPAAIRPHSLIEESGKSAELTLQEPNAAALKTVKAGDPAELVPTARGASVQSTDGAILGHIEPAAGLRLRRLMEGGNTYAVVIRKVAEDTVVYVRELQRAPGQQDQPSFLPPASAARRRAAAPRAYTKASMLRYEGSDLLDDDAEEPDGGWGARGSGSDDDEMDEAGFGDASLQDDDDDAGLAVDDDDEPVGRDDDDEM